MKVLLLGAGGREHALGWALTRSGRVRELLSLPGNPGLAQLGSTIEGVDPTEVGAVAALARIHSVDLVVVGPEQPLAAGVVDAVSRLGIPIFGPSRNAARMESSKTFAKDVMERAGVPTPGAASFTDAAAARNHLSASPGPYVVKADGLAAGKGVLVTTDRDEAVQWAGHCLGGAFGSSGSTVVVEEFVAGPELSVFAICDGENAILLEPARDYKRAGDGDTGPNTGGMGSYSPVALPPGLEETVLKEVFQPILRQLAEDGSPYTGFLYAGLILGPDGPKVIEFNARLGDPETQVVLPRLETDLVDVIETTLERGAGHAHLEWSPKAAVNVVLATADYPESSPGGFVIAGLDQPRDEVLLFHAGTAFSGRKVVTAGGRILSVVGMGSDLEQAADRAYAAAAEITFKGRRYRHDIARRPASAPREA